MTDQQRGTDVGLELVGMGAAALLLVVGAAFAGVGLGTLLWVGW